MLKPGYLTTEFWTTILVHALSGLVTLTSLYSKTPFDGSKLQPLIPVAALFMSAIAQAYYSYSRGKVKAAPLPSAEVPVAVNDNALPPFNG